MKKGFFFLISISFATALFCSCLNPEKPNCEKGRQIPVVLPLLNDTITYMIDTTFVDITFLPIIWGRDRAKVYTIKSDTLTLDWYYRNGRLYTDSSAALVVENMLIKDSIAFCDHKVEKVGYCDMEGFYTEVNCKKKLILIFFGINKTSGNSLYSEYRTTPDNKECKNTFFCLLNSMNFK